MGKSTLLSKMTKTESAVGAYEFTTLTVRLDVKFTHWKLITGYPWCAGIRGC